MSSGTWKTPTKVCSIKQRLPGLARRILADTVLKPAPGFKGTARHGHAGSWKRSRGSCDSHRSTVHRPPTCQWGTNKPSVCSLTTRDKTPRSLLFNNCKEPTTPVCKSISRLWDAHIIANHLRLLHLLYFKSVQQDLISSTRRPRSNRVNKTAEFSSHDVMLFLPDDGFQPDLELGEEFLVR